MHTLAAGLVIVIFSVGGNGIERRSWQFNPSISTLLIAKVSEKTSVIQGR